MKIWDTTAVGPVHIAAACSRLGARLVHLSSDAVFSGGPGWYDESASPTPATVYGAAKAEVGVAAATDDAVVLRTSWIVGRHSWFERFVRDLGIRRGRRCALRRRRPLPRPRRRSRRGGARTVRVGLFRPAPRGRVRPAHPI
ncbi:sugar nucleotide-binding protein [Glycomyces halotolerans]